jgi:hypothetical protein
MHGHGRRVSTRWLTDVLEPAPTRRSVSIDRAECQAPIFTKALMMTPAELEASIGLGSLPGPTHSVAAQPSARLPPRTFELPVIVSIRGRNIGLQYRSVTHLPTFMSKSLEVIARLAAQC